MYNTHKCNVRIVYDNLSESDAFHKEKELIKYYRENTNYRLTNITDGGEGTSGLVVTPETKRKLSVLSKKMWKDPEFRDRAIKLRQAPNGPYKSTEFKTKISRLVSGKNNPNYNNRWTQEQKDHLSKIRKQLGVAKGANNPKSKKIICLETGDVFNTIEEARKKYDVKNESSFSVALKDKKRTAAGLHWRYYDERLLDEEYRFNELLVSFRTSYFAVICIDDNFIFPCRKKFLEEIGYGIKKFLKEYDTKKEINYNNKKYMYVEDYISRYMK